MRPTRGRRRTRPSQPLPRRLPAPPPAPAHCRGRRTAPQPSCLPLECLVAELDRVPFTHTCRLQDSLELCRRRQRAGDAEAAFGSEHPIPAAGGLRAIDEIVDELLLVA